MSLNSIKSILPRRGHHNSFLFAAEPNMLTQIQCNSWTVKENSPRTWSECPFKRGDRSS